MLKIKFDKKKDSDFKSITVNGILDQHSFYSEGFKRAYLYNEKVIEILNSHTFAEFKKYFNSLNYSYDVDWWSESVDIITIIKPERPSEIAQVITVELKVDFDLWSAGYSVLDFSEALKIVIKESGNERLYYHQDDDDFVANGFGYSLGYDNLNEKLEEVLNRTIALGEKLVKETNQRLNLLADKEIISSLFNFPESIKTPCEQYLMYFAQFLQDLGIDVETEIKESAHSTLFKIIPKDKTEALDKIKQALDVYMNAPAMNDLQFQNVLNGDLAMVQFHANIMHLKSQIMFANATIQMKDVTIEALLLSNFQLQNQLSHKKENEAEVIPGIVSIKKYDGKWFAVDLPEILKRLKRSIK